MSKQHSQNSNGRKSAHQTRIEQFMRLAEEKAPGLQNLPALPVIPSPEVRMLRARLIMEEALETVEALGFDVFFHGRRAAMPDSYFEPSLEPDLIAIADGCGDLSVVSIGTLSACGIPDRPILEAIDANNIAKFGPGAWVDDNGKLRKPPDHVPPDLGRILEDISNG